MFRPSNDPRVILQAVLESGGIDTRSLYRPECKIDRLAVMAMVRANLLTVDRFNRNDIVYATAAGCCLIAELDEG